MWLVWLLIPLVFLLGVSAGILWAEHRYKRGALSKSSGSARSLKCTCMWEWPEITTGDPNDPDNILCIDPHCPVHGMESDRSNQ